MVEFSVDSTSVSTFIEGWLNHFNIAFEKDVLIPEKKNKLNYILSEHSTGILISEWKKPISVQVINNAIHALKEFSLCQIYIVAKKLSDHARDTLERLQLPIIPIHPNGLSEIAIKLVNLNKMLNNYVSN